MPAHLGAGQAGLRHTKELAAWLGSLGFCAGLGLGLGWVWVGFWLGWVGFGLGWGGFGLAFGLGWLGFWLGWLWVRLAL